MKVDVNGWLEAFAAHPQIGQTASSNHKSPTSAQLISPSLSLTPTYTGVRIRIDWYIFAFGPIIVIIDCELNSSFKALYPPDTLSSRWWTDQ